MFESTAIQREKLASDLRLVIADTEELLNMTAEQASESASQIRARLKSKLQQTTEQLSELQEITVAQVRHAAQATSEFVQENPWKSLGVASGIGLLVGLLISRRS
jgi:ElaB/YqjD/DUF883 family membrane-anchored ribosome-binding protein